MSVLAFSGVTRRFGDVVAVNRLDLELDPGTTALVGPNGAGKSTVMRLATGHVRPTSGTIRAFGEPVWDNPSVMARVGYVPEQDAFYEFMTGPDFVASLACIGGMGRREARRGAEEELGRLGLDEGWDRPIRTYSKGMRQRVKLAQALVHAPALLLLDEPLLGCDPVARRRIQDRVRSLAAEGCTVLVSSHILPEVERLTRRIAVLAGGRLIAEGDAAEVRDRLSQVPSRIRLFTGAPRRVAADLAAWDIVATVHVEDDLVDIETPRMRDFLARLQEAPRKEWRLRGVDTVDADLQSLFTYLTGGGA